jgi:hypothetical protein
MACQLLKRSTKTRPSKTDAKGMGLPANSNFFFFREDSSRNLTKVVTEIFIEKTQKPPRENRIKGKDGKMDFANEKKEPANHGFLSFAF